MRRFLHLIIFALCTLTIACAESPKHSLEHFTESIYTPKYASGFDIKGNTDSANTLIALHKKWQGDKSEPSHLLVVRDTGDYSNFRCEVIKAPVKRIVAFSSSYIAMVDALGEAQSIVGVSGIEYISNNEIQERYKNGTTKDVGYDTNINFELLLALQPDIVLLYGVSGEQTTITSKLQEIDIPYIYIGDYAEHSPIGKAEWAMVIAELFDKRSAGEELIGAIAERYNTIKGRSKSTSKRVMLNTPYRDSWFMPSRRSYMVRLIEDAGGEYIYPQNNSSASQPIDMESAYLLANEADVWLNVGHHNTLESLLAQNPKFASTPCVKSGQVWNNNLQQTPRGGSDFWESGVMRPDVVLQDIQNILNGTAQESIHYYKRLK